MPMFSKTRSKYRGQFVWIKRPFARAFHRFKTPSGHTALVAWKEILKRDSQIWQSAIRHSKDGPKVLIATSTGGHGSVTPVESLLAVALTLRGANVHILLCDRFLPACLRAKLSAFDDVADFATNGPAAICASCYPRGFNTYKALGLPIHSFSTQTTSEEQNLARQIAQTVPFDEIPNYHLNELAVGEHALAGAIRFYGSGDLASEEHGEPILRRYLEAALLSAYASGRLIEQHNFQVSCFHHGVYVPQGIIGEVARQHSVAVVNWSKTYRKHCFVFSHERTYHHTLMHESTQHWENMDWTLEKEKQLVAYLESRRTGKQDWQYVHKSPQEELDLITRQLNLNFAKPTVGLLTNVIWDANIAYPDNIFKNMMDWLIQTIAYFVHRPNLQLVIRVHPGEVNNNTPSRQPVIREVAKAFSNLPSNIHIIAPESDVSTYTLMEQCNAVIIYGTKTGVELTSRGIPVIVAGEAWIKNKSITYDPGSTEEYFRILDQLPFDQGLNDEQIRRARMYAYHFFFRRMIPLSMVESGPTQDHIQIDNLSQLMPGRELGLDVICDGILKGSPFIYEPALHNTLASSYPLAGALT